MNTKNYILIFIILIFCLGCHKAPTQIEPKEDLSESEFKEVILGKRKSAYEKQGDENVKYLELDEKGNAKIIIIKNDNKNEFEGNYSIRFLRPPSKDMVTFAELTIKTSERNIILSQVNFGYHNALPVKDGPFLRIDETPFGALKKI